MPRKSKKETTTLYEVYISLATFEKRIVCHVNADERERLISVFEGEREGRLGFYGFDLAEGLECYVNLAHITKINVLDYLAGLPFERPPEKTEEEWSKQMEERDQSDDSMIFRVWMVTGRNLEVFHDVNYHEWLMIRTALEEHDQHFIGFDDEDAERVILALSHIAAIEVFDTHYLTDEDLARTFKDENESIA